MCLKVQVFFNINSLPEKHNGLMLTDISLRKQRQQSCIMREKTHSPCTSYRAIANVVANYQCIPEFHLCLCVVRVFNVTRVTSPMNGPLTVQCIFIIIDAPAQGTTEESLHMPSLTWVILHGTDMVIIALNC